MGAQYHRKKVGPWGPPFFKLRRERELIDYQRARELDQPVTVLLYWSLGAQL